jgi:hypothetical protein
MTDPNTPIQNDVDAAVSSGNMADTTSQTGTGNPPLASAQNGPPSAPSAPGRPAPSMATPNPSAPNANQTSNQSTAPAPQPSLHARIFDKILQHGAGRPVQDANGQPQPMTRGYMGRFNPRRSHCRNDGWLWFREN